MNADPAVMEHFPALLTREQSDALDRHTQQSSTSGATGLWALEVRETGEFIGFTGLVRQTFEAPFTPAVEVGWRLARAPGATATRPRRPGRHSAYGFERGRAGRDRLHDHRDQPPLAAVMQRLGMTRDPADDFDYPRLPEGHPLRPTSCTASGAVRRSRRSGALLGAPVSRRHRSGTIVLD